jgi:murein DD-endopeptidase MepM/ murein hydrolase activator NlpD
LDATNLQLMTTYKFLTRPLDNGAYEPEGIYLSAPMSGECRPIQFWGDHSEYYNQFHYHGVPLKGHNGIDFRIAPNTYVLAVDPGRITEIGEERGGIGRYIKIEHRWGESLYGHLDTIVIDAGQHVARGDQIATVGESEMLGQSGSSEVRTTYLHFGIRIKPFNRFDGWGGFTDPLPYLNPATLRLPGESDFDDTVIVAPHTMVQEKATTRRP